MIGRKRYEDEPELWNRAIAVNRSGIVITDPNLPDNPIVYANPGFEQLTGYFTEEVVGRNCRFLQGSNRDQPALEELRIALREGRDCKVVLRNYKKDGTLFWNELSVSPLRDETGRLANFVGVQNDVTERKEAERRVATQHTVTRVLAECDTLDNAAPRILQALCENLRWEFGELWNLDRQASVLRCVQTWHVSSGDVAEFGRITRQHTFTSGVGLPGRVWSSGEPAWITDVTEDAGFLRASVAAQAGLRGAVAFPILLGGEVLGVVGFYSQEIREPDGEVLQMMSTIGSQIGQFIERKRAEEALRRSEQHLRSVVTNAPVVLFALDREGVFTLSEGKGLDDLGLEPGQLVGSSVFEVYRETPQIVADVRRALAGEEFSAVTETDGLFFQTWYSPVLLAESGEVAGVIGVAMDVTRRMKTEAKLLASEAELRAIFSAMSDVILVLDSEGRYLRIAPTNPSLLYKPSRDLIGKTLHEVFPAEQADLFLAHVRRALQTRQPVDIEYSLQIDGKEVWFAATVSSMLEDSVAWVARDVTERKNVERELIEGARQAVLGEDVGAALNEGGNLRIVLRRCAEAIVQHLDASFARIWTLNEEENVLELQASAGVYTHLEGSHSRVPVGKFKIGLIAQERLPYLTNDVAGDPRIHDKEWARREGMVAFAGYPLIVEDRLVGVLAMFARERLAEATLNALASIAGTIAQGIERKRAEENLRAYAARLNRSNRDLQDFAYVASHDLQEPLRKVRTFADRLNVKYAEVLGEQGRDYLQRMEGAAARMQDLIDDLLELSRVTTKAQPFATVDLHEVAQEVISDLEARIDQIGGQVRVSGLPTVEADRPQMRQLLQNLIGNALKFHREKEAPVVRVYGEVLRKRQEDPEGRAADSRVCQILVEDNGIGFDEEHLERIFVPFQRLHGRAAYEGTGMGLAICRKVVERHGGNITAKSVPGRGATFMVTLPVKQFKGNQ